MSSQSPEQLLGQAIKQKNLTEINKCLESHPELINLSSLDFGLTWFETDVYFDYQKEEIDDRSLDYGSEDGGDTLRRVWCDSDCLVYVYELGCCLGCTACCWCWFVPVFCTAGPFWFSAMVVISPIRKLAKLGCFKCCYCCLNDDRVTEGFRELQVLYPHEHPGVFRCFCGNLPHDRKSIPLTPLQLAVCICSDLKIIQLLLEFGAHRYARSIIGFHALDFALHFDFKGSFAVMEGFFPRPYEIPDRIMILDNVGFTFE